MRIVTISPEIRDPMIIDFEQVELMYVVPGDEEAGLWPAIAFEMTSGRTVYGGPFRTSEKASQMIGTILDGYAKGSAVLSMEI